eukprot:6178556-Pleurochrysis_carterae.AAC.1
MLCGPRRPQHASTYRRASGTIATCRVFAPARARACAHRRNTSKWTYGLWRSSGQWGALQVAAQGAGCRVQTRRKGHTLVCLHAMLGGRTHTQRWCFLLSDDACEISGRLILGGEGRGAERAKGRDAGASANVASLGL